VGQRKHKFSCIRQVVANTTEPSICGRDAALCQNNIFNDALSCNAVHPNKDFLKKRKPRMVITTSMHGLL